MSADHGTEQEAFWAGPFGDAYAGRNRGPGLLAAKTALLTRIMMRTGRIQSAVEFGANIGLNLRALRILMPSVGLTGVEINRSAWEELRRIEGVNAVLGSIFDFEPGRRYDLVLTSGLLIHLASERLPRAYDVLHACTGRHLCLIEYYNPTPVEVPYRGHAGRLFKRDFAGEMLDRFPDLRLQDYGFVYRRDPAFPADDLTWFLLERTG